MKKNKIVAVLGPTNTGKTFFAIETMLSFDSGMIGFPLRLLAREIYDKVIKKINPQKIALITSLYLSMFSSQSTPFWNPNWHSFILYVCDQVR